MTAHLAAALGERGLSVLAIDLDMNYGLTQHFGVDPEAFLGTYEVMIGEENPEDVIITNDDEGVRLPPGVHLIASRRKLEDIGRALVAKGKFVIPQDTLLAPMARILALDRYDFVLLDTAPNATPPTLAAYRTAHWFLVTAMLEPFGIRGLNDTLQDICAARLYGNSQLRLLGVALSAVDKRTRIARTIATYLQGAFAEQSSHSHRFQTEIGRSTAVPSAQKDGKTLFQVDPSHRVTHHYRALTHEIVQRLNGQRSARDANYEGGNGHCKAPSGAANG
jgi:chromosome partitioning protein